MKTLFWLPVAALLATTASNLPALTFTVTNTSGSRSVAGSLPWALQTANYNKNGFDRIIFRIPGSGQKLITLPDKTSYSGTGGTLYVNEPVSIDGTTQPGYAGKPLIAINANGNYSGIYMGAIPGGSTFAGLCIYGFSSNAITIIGSHRNWIRANWLGFNITSAGRVIKTTGMGYKDIRAIGIEGNYNTVMSNVICGVDNGIFLGGAEFNSIRYNYVGMHPDGTSVIGNTGDGIFMATGASRNQIGPENIFSGQASAGVELLAPLADGNVIFRNIVGMDKAMRNPRPNGDCGVLIANGAKGNAVGGAWGGNHIAHNRVAGVLLGLGGATSGVFGASDGNWVQYNEIRGSGSETNKQTTGVSIEAGSKGNVVEVNTIAGHSANGVLINRSNGNVIRNNAIGKTLQGTVFQNLGFGVCLISSGGNSIFGNAFGLNSLGNVGNF